MKSSNFVSTIFIASTFACIVLFACIFWFYSNADSKTLGLLKDSLSTASGFFGGITTLIAAYIASKLFNRWQDQHNKTVDKEIIFGVMTRLNDYLYAVGIFHTNIGIFTHAIEQCDYNFTPTDMQKFKGSLRESIVDFENSKKHMITIYSDLEAVMGRSKYTEFQNQCQCICDAADLYTKDLDTFLNQLLSTQYSRSDLELEVSGRSARYDFIVNSDGGLIDRIKAIKTELNAFYRAN